MRRLFHHLAWLIKGVKVFALVGKSGTGKSFRAKLVAEKWGIDLIIDDGLLIRDDKIIAGRSAKKERAFLGAIRTALFDDNEHRKEVRIALDHEHFKRVLILGTSERMVAKIAETLGLPSVSRTLHIEDIASKEEIGRAMSSRSVEGSHVIPVPPLEVAKTYPHMVYDSIKLFLQRSLGYPRNSRVFEKTVVRPRYSRRGRVTISEIALTQMVLQCADEFDHSLTIRKVSIKETQAGYSIDIFLHVPFGVQLAGNLHNFQDYVIENLERFTGILIEEANVNVERVTTR